MYLRWLVSAALLVATGAVRVEGQVSVIVAPDNGSHPDPNIRLVNSTGNTVTFTVTNNGTMDTQYTRTCTGLGNVTTVTCTTIGLIAAGGSKNVTATFSVAAAGTGSVQLSVTSTSPTGASGIGKWDETIVSPGATVTPDALPVSVGPNRTGLTQAFTVSNTARAAGTYTIASACTGTGVSGCSLSASTVTLDSAGMAGASGTVTVTYNSSASAQTGTITVTASYLGSNLDQGSVLVSIPAAAVTPDGGSMSVSPNLAGQTTTFTIQNTGPVTATYPLSATCTGAGVSFCSASSGSVTLSAGHRRTSTSPSRPAPAERVAPSHSPPVSAASPSTMAPSTSPWSLRHRPCR